jgi:hypothetical protein
VRHAEARMPYKTKAAQEREKWMTLPEAVDHICDADGCDERTARHKLIAVLADDWRILGPPKWERERGDRSPPFGYTPATTPTDTPPLGPPWSQAKIRWKTGRVRDDWGEYKPGKWRVLLVSRDRVARQWPLPPANDQTQSAASNVTSLTAARKRGRKPVVGPKVSDSMRQDLRTKRFTVQQLDTMTEEALKAEYGASRDICREARKTVLSESEFVAK